MLENKPLAWVDRPIGILGSRPRVLEEGGSIRSHTRRRRELFVICPERLTGEAPSKADIRVPLLSHWLLREKYES